MTDEKLIEKLSDLVREAEKTFEVDVDTSVRLRRLVPPEILFVSESGIRTPEDIRRLRENGTDGVLIGETLMRSPDKRAALEELNGGRL